MSFHILIILIPPTIEPPLFYKNGSQRKELIKDETPTTGSAFRARRTEYLFTRFFQVFHTKA